MVQIHELILVDTRISAKSITEQLGISREWIGSIIHADVDLQKLSVKWVPKTLNAYQNLLRRLAPLTFWSAFWYFGPHFAESFRISKSSWTMDPIRSRKTPSCSAIDLVEIRRSSKISSWIWSIISGVVAVVGRTGRGASQVEKSPRLNWATQFLTMAHDGACSPNVSFRMAWISFGVLPCRGNNTCWQPASRCCWNLALRLKCFLSASVTRKDLQFGTWTDPSFLRH